MQTQQVTRSVSSATDRPADLRTCVAETHLRMGASADPGAAAAASMAGRQVQLLAIVDADSATVAAVCRHRAGMLRRTLLPSVPGPR